MSDSQDKTNLPGSRDEREWERDLLNRLAFAAVNEQRRHRRWGIFFKSLGFAYLLILLILAFTGEDLADAKSTKTDHTAVVQVNGLISDTTDANAETIIQGLRDAFEAKHSKGVILRINSPGGSPVQAAYVFDEVRRLREKYPDKPLYAVVVDIGASGAYYIAAAADKIYVNQASIVGSIGVLMNGFGFTEVMKKVGVERRLFTAGEHKGMLDPFSPLKDGDVDYAHQLLESIHQQFIAAVKTGRGDRLHDSPELFSGKFWTGEEGIRLGLADEIGNVNSVARDVIGAEEVVDYTPSPDLLKRFADRLGLSMANTLSQTMGLSGNIR